MPKESEIANKFPNSFLGEYLEIYFNENAVGGYFKTISKTSNRKYLIESKEIVFIDSLNWANQKWTSITGVNVENNYFEIVTKDNKYRKEFADTLSSKLNKKEFEIDLANGFFYDSFNSKEEYEDSKRNCQLRKKNGKFYLNIQYFDKYWMISRISNIENKLILNSTNFSLQDERELSFAELKTKYNFERIQFEENRKMDWDYYLANSDNEEMENVLNEDFFEGIIWHKINKKRNNWIPISIGVLIFIGIAYQLRRIIKKKNDREQRIKRQ